jgi:hypothetical protein
MKKVKEPARENYRFFSGSFMKMVNSFKGFEITGAGGSLFLNVFPQKNRTSGSLSDPAIFKEPEQKVL